MAAIFAILLADRVATGAPVLVAVLLGAALLLTMALEYRRWNRDACTERAGGEPHPEPLRQRLDEARGGSSAIADAELGGLTAQWA